MSVILRKPYAFIIKHFRLIHLIILAMLIYILVDLNSINQLFNNFQRTNTYTYLSANLYINNLINYAIGVGFIMSGIVFWLLKQKKKPTNLYLGLFVYFIILFIGYIFINSRLTAIQTEIFESDQLILVKDVTFLLSLPMFVFLPLCFIRGIGFNIKQFNFSKDVAELKIAEEDSQEFEVLIGQNNYLYFRTIRRVLREIKYFIFENKFPLSIIASVLAVILIISGIRYYNEYLKKINQAEVTSINSISYIVNKSYITARDYKGDEIKDGYKYVVIDMAFHNISDEPRTLDLTKIILANGNILYYPTLTKNAKFYDLGVPYKDSQIISGGQMLEATLAFEIPKSVSTRNFTLKIQYGIDDSYKNILVQYKNFKVNTTSIDADEVTYNKKLKDSIIVNIVDRNAIELAINDYAIMDVYDNKYVACMSLDNCHSYSSIIKSADVTTKTMLVVDFEWDIDTVSNIYKTFDTTNKLFENYSQIRYIADNKQYTIPAKVIINSDVDSKVFFEAPRNIIGAKEIQLEMDFRDYLYIVKLL